MNFEMDDILRRVDKYTFEVAWKRTYIGGDFLTFLPELKKMRNNFPFTFEKDEEGDYYVKWEPTEESRKILMGDITGHHFVEKFEYEESKKKFEVSKFKTTVPVLEKTFEIEGILRRVDKNTFEVAWKRTYIGDNFLTFLPELKKIRKIFPFIFEKDAEGDYYVKWEPTEESRKILMGDITGHHFVEKFEYEESKKKTVNTKKKTVNTKKKTVNTKKKTVNTKKKTVNTKKKTVNTKKKAVNTKKKADNTKKKADNTKKKTVNTKKKTVEDPTDIVLYSAQYYLKEVRGKMAVMDADKSAHIRMLTKEFPDRHLTLIDNDHKVMAKAITTFGKELEDCNFFSGGANEWISKQEPKSTAMLWLNYLSTDVSKDLQSAFDNNIFNDGAMLCITTLFGDGDISGEKFFKILKKNYTFPPVKRYYSDDTTLLIFRLVKNTRTSSKRRLGEKNQVPVFKRQKVSN
jgi:predicted RNase H-like HicB family nuclease